MKRVAVSGSRPSAALARLLALTGLGRMARVGGKPVEIGATECTMLIRLMPTQP